MKHGNLSTNDCREEEVRNRIIASGYESSLESTFKSSSDRNAAHRTLCNQLAIPHNYKQALMLRVQKSYLPVIQVVLRCHDLELSFLDKVFKY